MDKFAIAQMKTVEGTTSNVTINGVPVNNKVLVSIVNCSNCNNILVQFQPNQPLKSKYEYINNNLKNEVIYCPKCGCKLDYGGFEILNADINLNGETSTN